jgi:outer membrane protein OmpA-like peptidoglycan-associated protein
MGPQRAFHHFLTLITLATTIAAGPVFADEEKWAGWDNSPELQSPQPDSKGRSGYWWWPESTGQLNTDKDTRGNRGRIFGPLNKKSWVCCLPPGPQEPSIPPDDNPIVCNFPYRFNNIIFPFDSIVLSKEGKLEADKLIEEMSKFPNDTAVCVGHTDDVGTESYNLQLGLRRAQAVVDYIATNGIAPTRLRAESRGETEPAVRNDTPVNRALNRRVVFEVTLRN